MSDNIRSINKYRPFSVDEAKYLSALDNLVKCIWVYDPFRKRQLYANKSALQLWSCATLEEFQQKDFTDNSAATDRFFINLEARFRKAIQRGEAPEPVQPRWTFYPKGKPVQVDITVSPHILRPFVLDEDQLLTNDRVLHMVEGVVVEVPIQQDGRGLEALRHITSMVTLYDFNGNILLRNRASETEIQMIDDKSIAPTRCVGHTCKYSICSKTFLPYVVDRTVVDQILDTVFTTNDLASFQSEVTVQNASDNIHLIHAAKIPDPVTGNNNYMIMINEEDITQAVKQENENRVAHLTSKLKDEFLANTSHELKTPLTGILGLAEALLDDPVILASAAEESLCNLQLIKQATKRMTTLVNDILELARLTHSVIALNKVNINVKEAIDQVFSLSAPITKLKQKNERLQLINEVPPSFVLLADEPRFKQAIHYLISYVIESSKFTTVKVTGEAKMVNSTTDEMFWLMLTISAGIANPYLRRNSFVFEPFLSACTDNMLAKSADPHGLRLAITKKVVDLHNGKLDVHSDHQGIKIEVYLPGCRKEIPSQGVQPSKVNYCGSLDPSLNDYKPNILCVDDDPINQRILDMILSKNGYSVTKAASGNEALDCLANSVPDAILLDVFMPGMSGFELCELIRHTFSTTQLPIVLLSGNSQPEFIEEGLKRGANAYLCKPFDKDQLLQQVKEITCQHRV